jgi:hypothetical protein
MRWLKSAALFSFYCLILNGRTGSLISDAQPVFGHLQRNQR